MNACFPPLHCDYPPPVFHPRPGGLQSSVNWSWPGGGERKAHRFPPCFGVGKGAISPISVLSLPLLVFVFRTSSTQMPSNRSHLPVPSHPSRSNQEVGVAWAKQVEGHAQSFDTDNVNVEFFSRWFTVYTQFHRFFNSLISTGCSFPPSVFGPFVENVRFLVINLH